MDCNGGWHTLHAGALGDRMQVQGIQITQLGSDSALQAALNHAPHVRRPVLQTWQASPSSLRSLWLTASLPGSGLPPAHITQVGADRRCSYMQMLLQKVTYLVL